jgi:hypothetical protein
VAPIRRVLGESPFTGEGHRKVWARLRYQGIRTSKARVRRLMREHGRLAPSRATRVWGPRHHDGTLLPEAPDRMWGTDATTTFTLEAGQVTVFIAVDPFTAAGVVSMRLRWATASRPWSRSARASEDTSLATPAVRLRGWHCAMTMGVNT